MKKSYWPIFFVIIILVAACFGFYYLGQRDKQPSGVYNPVIDDTRDFINVDPGFEDKLEESVYYSLKPVSKAYGIGDLDTSNMDGDLTTLSGSFDFWQFNEYKSSAFINVQRLSYENSKDSFVSLRFSTKIGNYVDSSLSETYDASVVFGFENIGTKLLLKFSYVSYGDGSLQEFNFQGNPQFGKWKICSPNMLTTNYQDVCLLLGEEGLTVADSTWKIVNSDNVVFVKNSVLSSIKKLVSSIVNEYKDTTDCIHSDKGLEVSNIFSVKNDVSYDYIVSDFWYSNMVKAENTNGFETVEYMLNTMFDTKGTDFYIPIVNVEI